MKDVIFGWIYGRFDVLTVIWRDPKTGSPWYCMLLLRIPPWHWETLLVSLHLQHVRVRPHRHSHRPAPSGWPNRHTAWASIWPLWGDYSHTLFSPLHHLPAGWLHNSINLAWEVKTDTAVVVWGVVVMVVVVWWSVGRGEAAQAYKFSTMAECEVEVVRQPGAWASAKGA